MNEMSFPILMRGLDQCRSEFSLMALGYNFRRMVNERAWMRSGSIACQSSGLR